MSLRFDLRGHGGECGSREDVTLSGVLNDLCAAVGYVREETGVIQNLANEMSEAGYTDAEAVAIKAEVAHYANVRDEVKLGAGEDIDFKQYGPVCVSCSTPASG